MVHLNHIIECVHSIQTYIRDEGASFQNDRKTQKAVLRELQELSQSVRSLPSRLTDSNPQIPWRAIAGFRNILVHDYLGLNMASVWSIVQKDLPPLLLAVSEMVRIEKG
ncbi:DUF86 domain-containing protein [bacterium]|nr:DUF86 domain-containing protein [bacterium]